MKKKRAFHIWVFTINTIHGELRNSKKWNVAYMASKAFSILWACFRHINFIVIFAFRSGKFPQRSPLLRHKFRYKSNLKIFEGTDLRFIFSAIAPIFLKKKTLRNRHIRLLNKIKFYYFLIKQIFKFYIYCRDLK